MDENTVEDINGIKIYLSTLMANVDETTLNEIRHEFKENDGKLNEYQLHEILKSYDIVLSDEDFKPMFNKIDIKKEGTITFLQFIVYLSSEYDIKHRRNELNEEKLSKLMPKLLPSKAIRNKNKGQHKIDRFAYKPLINQMDEEVHPVHVEDGEYMTASVAGEIVFYSSDLKWKYTHVLDNKQLNGIVALPDFNVVCVSTLDYELHFYNVTPNDFKLCLTLTDMPNTTTCLAYTFNEDDMAGSKLAVGDLMGGVFVLEVLSSKKVNPFRGRPDESGPPSYHFDEIVKGSPTAKAQKNKKYPLPFHVIRFDGLHVASVNRIVFCDFGKSFVSVSVSDVMLRKSMAYCCVNTGTIRYVTSGDAVCVCAVDGTHLATGGMDKAVRLWDVGCGDPMRDTELGSHDKEVQYVFINRSNGYLYTVSADHVIKLWDLHRAVCLLTYDGAVPPTAADHYRRWYTAHFNQLDQVFVMVVGDAFMSIKCGDTAKHEHAVCNDSHDAAVVKTLYNSLFQLLISVSGADSVISVWNLYTGELITRRTLAHSVNRYCKTLPVEITAANFDPSGGLLATGAVNGTIHIWDPNNGTCLNRLQIPSKSRISEIIWLPNKILATGWDGRVTEFNDPLTVSNGKVWLKGHGEEVLSACVNPPSLLVTTSATGEMGFWRLDTGQLNKKYKVRTKAESSIISQKTWSTSRTSVKTADSEIFGSRIPDVVAAETKEETLRKLDNKHASAREHNAAVASHILRARPETANVGNLAISTRNGVVQLWCTHRVPKYVTQFAAAHIDGDYVTVMASDPKNNYLFTCLISGYVKTWYVAEFGVGKTAVVRGKHATMLSLRQRFPFLLQSFFRGQAELAILRNPGAPLLVNSYRAHLQCIRHVEYIDQLEMVVTSSVDKSIRVWTLAGHYVGTVGSPWPRISNTGAVTVTQFVVPMDIKRESSFTTIKVMMDGANTALRTSGVWDKLIMLRQQKELKNKVVKRKLHGRKCPKQPLHQIYSELEKVEESKTSATDPVLIKTDESMPKIQIFKYLPLVELDTVPSIQSIYSKKL